MKCLRNVKRAAAVYDGFRVKDAAGIRAFHESMPSYAVSPLHELNGLSQALGLACLAVKDESTRFGLNAFKGLGGTYCVASCLADLMGLKGGWNYEDLCGGSIAKPVFATATDGNHGRGIAYAARLFGCPCHVYLPKGSARERVENIRREGAQTLVTDVDYDETVRIVAQKAREEHWILVQDTAWEGYTEVPKRIMQGYLTMGDEIREQMQRGPTHIFLQAGVGSMAASLCAYFRDLYGEEPVISIVEAVAADCLYETARAGDGQLHATGGNMQTMMAGLCCGYPCLTAWQMLEKQADFFLAIEDVDAAAGMRILAHPCPGDDAIESGESGASSVGTVVQIMRQYPEVQKTLGLNRDSVVLCISTEGATDRENYQRIVCENGE